MTYNFMYEGGFYLSMYILHFVAGYNTGEIYLFPRLDFTLVGKAHYNSYTRANLELHFLWFCLQLYIPRYPEVNIYTFACKEYNGEKGKGWTVSWQLKKDEQ